MKQRRINKSTMYDLKERNVRQNQQWMFWRTKNCKMSRKDVLFHYCNIESFASIIKNASIWLSDVSKSNDYLECVLCRNKIKESIEKILAADEKDLEAWKWGYDHGCKLNREIYSYCVCFSENCDQLSQWRGYANNGKGIAIGFDKNILDELKTDDIYRIAFDSVIYDSKEQEDYIGEVVNENLEKMRVKGIAHVGIELNTNYRLKFPFVKNPSFWEEGEWRIVVSAKPGSQRLEASDNISFSEVRYRVANDKLISYLEMDFSKIKQKIIKEIWIGPKSEVTVDDVVNFLYTYGYYDDVEEGFNANTPILVTKSNSSYR